MKDLIGLVIFMGGGALLARGLWEGDKNRTGEVIAGVLVMVWAVLYAFGAVL